MQIDGLTGVSLSFRQLGAAVLQLAAALYSQGVRQGEVVMICGPNRIEYPIWALAVTYLGGIFTTSNPNYVPGSHILHCYIDMQEGPNTLQYGQNGTHLIS